ncbi:MAG: hypothetical protein ABSD63_18840 [Candidatus Korobacteraceae bacterium]|jgi:hypothetical protein
MLPNVRILRQPGLRPRATVAAQVGLSQGERGAVSIGSRAQGDGKMIFVKKAERARCGRRQGRGIGGGT